MSLGPQTESTRVGGPLHPVTGVSSPPPRSWPSAARLLTLETYLFLRSDVRVARGRTTRCCLSSIHYTEIRLLVPPSCRFLPRTPSGARPVPETSTKQPPDRTPSDETPPVPRTSSPSFGIKCSVGGGVTVQPLNPLSPASSVDPRALYSGAC